MLTPTSSLQELINHSKKVYGRRNSISLPGLRDRADALIIRVGDVQNALRKKPAMAGVALARAASMTFCVITHFHHLPFVALLAQKYPSSGCSYCGGTPCLCNEDRRPSPRLAAATDPAQLQWSLGRWCEHFAAVYGQINSGRNVGDMVNRLFKEVAEVLLLTFQSKHMSIDEAERQFAFEIADVLSWIAALAGALGINLQDEFLLRYKNGCSTCAKNPCECPHVPLYELALA